ncbi:hypothetical protein HDU98_005326 [Podochytrium sp. JEL0797]|nr:hypothetical protein HDU98_005326 [Podochytrium sp. JEL0797]
MKESKKQLNVVGDMDEKRCRLMAEEAGRLRNSLLAPNITGRQKLAKAERLKQLCEEMQRWPGHAKDPLAIARIFDSFGDYANAYVYSRSGEDLPGCRKVVQQMEREEKAFTAQIYGVGARGTSATLKGLMGSVESRAGDHAAALIHFQASLDTHKQLCQDALRLGDRLTHSTHLELQGCILRDMMLSGHLLFKPHLTDQCFKSAVECFVDGTLVLRLRMEYLKILMSRCQKHDRDRSSAITMSRDEALLADHLSLAIQEAKTANEFAHWSQAMQYKTQLAIEKRVNFAAAFETARLVVRMHPCCGGGGAGTIRVCENAVPAKALVAALIASTSDAGLATPPSATAPRELPESPEVHAVPNTGSPAPNLMACAFEKCDRLFKNKSCGHIKIPPNLQTEFVDFMRPVVQSKLGYAPSDFDEPDESDSPKPSLKRLSSQEFDADELPSKKTRLSEIGESKNEPLDSLEVTKSEVLDSDAILREIMPTYDDLPEDHKHAIHFGICELFAEHDLPLVQTSDSPDASVLIPSEFEQKFREWLPIQLRAFDAELKDV